MSHFALAVVFGAIASSCWANLGDSEAQIQAKYGESVAIENQYWERVFTYHWQKYVVGVTFLDGKSQHEFYRHKDSKAPFTNAEIEQLLKHNSSDRDWRVDPEEGEYVLGADRNIEAKAWYMDKNDHYRLSVFTAEFDRVYLKQPLIPQQRLTGSVERFSGVLTLKQKEDGTYITLRSGADVLEIPWKQRYLWFVNLPVGELCTIVVRDERPLNLVPLIVFRSDREHRNREAMAADMFAVYPFIRIEQESRVVWDNSICEVHHTKMEHTTAPIVYGLYWPTPSDDVCDARYPHHFDYALGGDLLSGEDALVTQVYVCPKCFSECQIYKLLHPDLFSETE